MADWITTQLTQRVLLTKLTFIQQIKKLSGFMEPEHSPHIYTLDL